MNRQPIHIPKSPMRIFLAGIMQGSHVDDRIHEQDWRLPVSHALKQHLGDVEIYCHYSSHPNSLSYDMPQIRQTFDDGLEEARKADMVIAYLPSASMGTAIEMYEAYRSGAIILSITHMTTNWVVRLYSQEIFGSIEEFTGFLAAGAIRT